MDDSRKPLGPKDAVIVGQAHIPLLLEASGVSAAPLASSRAAQGKPAAICALRASSRQELGVQTAKTGAYPVPTLEVPHSSLTNYFCVSTQLVRALFVGLEHVGRHIVQLLSDRAISGRRSRSLRYLRGDHRKGIVQFRILIASRHKKWRSGCISRSHWRVRPMYRQAQGP